ncbi:MAG: ribonuclease HII [Parcubacteria group bacterium]|nr:ribonuclease HII [Parcubacteria group bacterium]
MQLIIGVDEAGRGPLAGPVSVGVFGAEKQMEKWLLKNIFNNKLQDSKKLSSTKREEIYKKFCELKKSGKIHFCVSHISNKIIDEKGISFAIKLGLKKSLNRIAMRYCASTTDAKISHISELSVKEIFLRLDGLLKAPEKFKNQKTIIKGDEKDVFIACASIIAKVERDRLMCRLGSKYPLYELQIHKGYGTALHRKHLQKHGLSPLHRKSFCKNYLPYF